VRTEFRRMLGSAASVALAGKVPKGAIDSVRDLVTLRRR
jgi:hypothetical protein